MSTLQKTSSGSSTPDKRANMTRAACAQCSRRKTKCSGERPTCSYCLGRGLACSWDIAEGMTRTSHLRQEIEVLQRSLETLQLLVNLLRTESDEAATTILARLRLGDIIEDIVASCAPESVEGNERTI